MGSSGNNCRNGMLSIVAVARSWRTLFIPACLCLVLILAQQHSVFAAGFSATASMGMARQSHTATLLNDGSVLVTGGYDGTSILISAELYNPDGTFSPIATPMNVARRDHTATRLADGRVLIAGGLTTGSVTTVTAEIYDPASRTFTPAGSMGIGRQSQTATLLQSGKVLITGGRSGTLSSTTLKTVELFTPAAAPGTGTFAAAGTMNLVRVFHTATLLSDGRVLIAGGLTTSSASTDTAELYDSAGAGSFTATGTMTSVRNYHAAVLLKDNTVLITGGAAGSLGASLQTAEIFTLAAAPDTGTFADAGTMWSPHSRHTATVLTSGNVLIAGSLDHTTNPYTSSGDTELYLPGAAAENRFDPEVAMTTARARYPAVLLPNGTVLLAGGATTDTDQYNNYSTDAAVIYNPSNISVEPGGYTFPDRAVSSTSPPQSFTISNAAGYALTVNSIEISGTDSAMFAWSSTCGALPTTIPAFGSCSVNVTFTPTSVGIKTASLDTTYEDIQIQVWPVSLKGTGIVPPASTVTVTFAATLSGPGAGSVHSSSTPAPVLPLQEISCVGGAGISCQGQFNNGTTVTLSATADSSNSLFGGWTGAGCTGTGNCVINNLSENTVVTATFNFVEPARINSTYYPSLKEAYAGAVLGVGNVIEARDFSFTGPLVFDQDIDVRLKGGYDLTYSLNPDYSVLNGKFTIRNGSVTVERIVVRGGI